MKRYRLLLGLLSVIVAACSVEETDNPEKDNLRGQLDVKYYAVSSEQTGEIDTKTFADSQLRVLWNEDDRITIFDKKTLNEEFCFDGEDGDNAGGFYPASSSGEEYVSYSDLTYACAVYPYQKSTKISYDGIVTFTLPEEQIYAPNSFGRGANTMIAKTETNQLKFMNVGGYLSFKFYGQGVSVTSIDLKGNNGEPLAGKCTISLASGEPEVTMASSNTSDKITLTCNTPIELSSSSTTPTEFWIVVPPTTFSQGITFTVHTSDGGVFKKSSSAGFTLGRNKKMQVPAMEIRCSLAEPIDLGLSVKWASYNVGATKPEEFGDYFAWGETEPKNDYSWETYKWCNGSYDSLTRYNTKTDYGTVDFKTQLELSDDAAYANWGGNWRIPTDAEWTELRENCTWTWTTLNGVNGYNVTSIVNGNSIFLPAASNMIGTSLYDVFVGGDYWSSTLTSGSPYSAPGVYINSSGKGRNIYYLRTYGLSIRPVYGEFVEVSSISLNKTSLNLSVAGSFTLSATIQPNNATAKDVIWSSSDPDVASVTDGVVTAVEEGTTTITAYASNGLNTSCIVTVKLPIAEAVDLGLSVKWASFNLGATKPEEYGDYYAWGETEPYYSSQDPSTWKDGKENGYAWSSYFDNPSGDGSTFEKYATDKKATLDLDDDAANYNWEGSWRMPTYEEWEELRTECTWTWTDSYNDTGVAGELVTGSNGNSIFLPASGLLISQDLSFEVFHGDYWSSSLCLECPNSAWDMNLFSSGIYLDYDNRFFGLSIRPVTE